MSNTGNPFTSTSNHKENNHVMISRGGEKKVMKKILSVALSTAMAFSMFASVAFGQTGLTDVNAQYNYLKDKGIFSGFPDGQAHLDRQMTRAEFAKVITKTLGLKEVEGVYSFKDKNYGENHWAAPYVEAVYAAGIMEGVNSTKKIFGVSNPVTIQEMATVLVRALDLEVPTGSTNSASAWAKDYVQAAINAGLVDANANFQSNATRQLLVGAAYAVDQELSLSVESYTVSEAGKVVEFKLTDGETVKVTLDKALEANKETEVKFTYQEKEFTEKVTYVVTSATKVDKASASNLKEVVVAFDGEVDEDTATEVANYSLRSGKVVKSASLSADKKTVTLTLEGTLTNNRTEAVSVSNVKAGDRTISATNVEFTAVDNQLPEATAVKSLGTKSVKIEFSEPVDGLTQSNFKIDGKEYFGKVELGAGNKSVILTPYSTSTLAVGAHSVTVSAVKDFAGFVSLTKSFDFEVVEDTAAPTVTTAEATLESVTLTFSEDVDASTVSASNIYWKSGDSKKTADSFEKVADNKYKFKFVDTNVLPTGTIVVYVEGVKDYSGNQIASGTTVSVNPVVDQTRPEVTRVTSPDAKTIRVQFNKELLGTSVTATGNYTVTKPDGTVLAVQSAALDPNDNKAVIVKLYNNLATGTNNITVKNLKDNTRLQNTMLDFSGSVTLGDTAAPTVDSKVVSNAQKRVVITFSEKMNVETLANYNNYIVNLNGNNVVLTNAMADISVINDGTAVSITFAERINNNVVQFATGNGSSAGVANIASVTVGSVTDLAGNILKEFTEAKGGNTVSLTDNQTVGFAQYNSSVAETVYAELVDRKTVKIKFTAGITQATVGAVTYTQDNPVTAVETNGTSVVTVKFSKDLETDARGLDLKVDLTKLITTAGSAAGSSSTPLEVKQANVLDSVAPVLVANPEVGVNTITLKYSEAIKNVNPALAASDIKLTRNYDNKVLSAATDYSVAISGSNVVITLDDEREYETVYRVVIDGATYLTDLGGKAVANYDGTTGLVAK
ncbi:S-layer homology domain-containing protein [Paenibacillus urinalis]|uniref:S-layer homology domain-containing protein n=1 Tax=Paenibacillus urinalis TaxID=521520 RepID=UPI0019614F8D